MSEFDKYQFRNIPGLTEASLRALFPTFVPLKTLVIHCIDPRATEIPKAVAEHFGDEVYPGDVVRNEAGNKVGSTTTLFAIAIAGGRAVGALQSISTMQHLANIKNVVVVHHSFCGATAFSADGIIDAFKHEHGVDISSEYDRESLCITDYERSLKYDVALLRSSPGVPKHAKLFGFFYNIDSGELTEVVRDAATPSLVRSLRQACA